MADLKAEFAYYLANQADFLKRYEGRVIVIKDKAVIGDYPSESEAMAETTKSHPLGTFLMQRCEPGATSQTFHSRVAFA